jgi:UDPglucose--hexose-1-phosphate uridylyltransferase
VVPNLYPAFERQEVVVHTPRHVRSLADLADAELQLIADAWQQRWSTGLDDGFLYVHALVNEGSAAGASLPHSHSQLVYLKNVPPTAVPPLDHARFQRDVEEEVRLVVKNDWVAAVCPYTSRVPYELVVAPLEHEEDAFLSPLLGAAFELLADCLRRLRAVEGGVPVNLWLRDTGTWCFEVFPRLTILAGVELGAGIYVNPLAPEEAAQALRQAQP